jgi:hypothetical protein
MKKNAAINHLKQKPKKLLQIAVVYEKLNAASSSYHKGGVKFNSEITNADD